MKITFIEAASGVPLVKKFTPSRKIPYPNVSLINSYEREASGLKELAVLIKDASKKGQAMMRGHFYKQLKNESRKDKSDKKRSIERVTFDFDNVSKPSGIASGGHFNARELRKTSEEIVRELGGRFTDISYIATASSSYGLKPDKVSLHLEFELASAVDAKDLKRYFQRLNLDNEWLRNQLKLSTNALTLSWPLDPSLADNTKLVFIGTPTFEGVTDPFANPDDRTIYVNKSIHKLTLNDISDISEGKLKEDTNKYIQKLRKEAGLRGTAPRIRGIVSSENELVELLLNPDPVTIEIVDDSGEFIHANLNDGDSCAYWWPKNNPDIIYNFKGEPAFYMRDAAPEFYKHCKKVYRTEIFQKHGLQKGQRPIVFREPNEDIYYSMIYNDDSDEITHFAPIGITNIKNFLVTRGAFVPEVHPEYTLEFDPTTNQQFDEAKGWVNSFRPTKFLKATGLPLGVETHTTYGNALETVSKIAPAFYQNIFHVLGSQHGEAEHFFNWLAFIMQKRDKTGTAWLFLGRSATGKGLLFHKFFAKVFGEYAKIANTENLDDNFNSFLADAIIVFVDEFRGGDSRAESKLYSSLKSKISEATAPIRRMRKAMVNMKSYSNFIFSSNETDVLNFGDDDRRYNIGTRQETRIIDAYGEDVPDRLMNEDELYKFCQLLNAHDVNEKKVQELIENEWRDQIRRNSLTAIQEFFDRVRVGDLDYFIEFIIYEPLNDDNERRHNAAKAIVFNWIRNMVSNYNYVSNADLLAVYNTMHDKPTTAPRFRKALDREKFRECRPADKFGKRVRSTPISWTMKIHTPEVVLAESYEEKRKKVVSI